MISKSKSKTLILFQPEVDQVDFEESWQGVRSSVGTDRYVRSARR